MFFFFENIYQIQFFVTHSRFAIANINLDIVVQEMHSMLFCW